MINVLSKVIKKELSFEPIVVERFFTGLCHYVYYVETKEKKYIFRLTKKENIEHAKGSEYWLKKLSHLDINIPKIIATGLLGDYNYVILTYIDGDDLGHVYKDLSKKDKFELSKKVIELQGLISTLPESKSFGHLNSYESNGQKSWADVLYENLNRSRKRFEKTKIFDSKLILPVYDIVERHLEVLNQVKAIPFLDDITTKNILIYNKKYSGIVDLDWVCFGDVKYMLALTKMALISNELDLEYTDYLEIFFINTNDDKSLLDLYVLIFCLDFMSEKGQIFNSDEPEAVSSKEYSKLMSIYKTYIDKLR